MTYGFDNGQPDAGMHQGATGAEFWKGILPPNLWEQNFGGAGFQQSPAQQPAGGGYGGTGGANNTADAQNQYLGQQQGNAWNTAAPAAGSGNNPYGMTPSDLQWAMMNNQPRMSSLQRALANQNRFAGWNTLAPEAAQGPNLDYLSKLNDAMAGMYGEYGRGGLAAQYGAQASMYGSDQNRIASMYGDDQRLAGTRDTNVANRDIAGIQTTPANRKVSILETLLPQLFGGGGGLGGGMNLGGLNLGGLGGGGGGGSIGGTIGGIGGDILQSLMGSLPYLPPPNPQYTPRSEMDYQRELTPLASQINQQAAQARQNLLGSRAGAGFSTKRGTGMQELLNQTDAQRLAAIQNKNLDLRSRGRAEDNTGIATANAQASKNFLTSLGLGSDILKSIFGNQQNQQDNQAQLASTMIGGLLGALG